MNKPIHSLFLSCLLAVILGFFVLSPAFATDRYIDNLDGTVTDTTRLQRGLRWGNFRRLIRERSERIGFFRVVRGL